jgi:CBS domain containing-hemolysin-like protein
MTQVLLLFGVAVLVALNGLFVAAEFALVRASQGRVEQLRDEGRRGAALVLKQIERIDEYLSACQLGITMTSLGIGFLGEPAIASLFEDLFGTSISHNASLAISLGIAYLITTALHITFGEQVPKIYSIVHSEATALRVARPLELFRTVFNPLI